MPTIKVLVRNKRASNQERLGIVCGNSDYQIVFDFDSEWDAYHTKTARFVWCDGYQDVVFAGNVCQVPVIIKARKVAVGVFAGDLRTTTPAYIDAEESILGDNNPPAEPPPDVFSQMVELAKAGVDESKINAADAKASEQAAARSAVEADEAKETTQALKETTQALKETAAKSAADAADAASKAEESMKEATQSAVNAEGSADAAALSAVNAKQSEDVAKQAAERLLILGSSSGKVATIEDAAHTNILDFTVNDGTDVQTVKIFGKNFFHRDYGSSVSQIGVTVEWDAENQEFIFNGTTTSVGDFRLVAPFNLDWEVGENYTVSVRRVSGTAKLPVGATGTTYSWSIFSNDAKKYLRSGNLAQDFIDVFTFTGKAFEAAGYIFYLQSWKTGTTFDNYRVKIQIEKGSAVTDWEAYREETVAFADAKSILLQRGFNNIVTAPSADITVDYVCDLQMYIDKKIAELRNS